MSIHTFIGNLPYYLLVAIVFLLMISVLVFAHELGHYLFARLFNMGVEEFAVGFGKRPIWTYARRKYVIPLTAEHAIPEPGVDLGYARARPVGIGEAVAEAIEGGGGTSESVVVETATGRELHEQTNFTIRPIPAGGFVRIKGMLPEEDGSETRIPGGFYSKPPWQRFIVLLAGPAFSVLAGILILVPVYMGEGISKRDQRPIIGDVTKGKPADRAHLEKGDLILTVQGKPVSRFYDFIQVVSRSANVPLLVTFERKGHEYSTTVTPEMDTQKSPVLNQELELTGDFRMQAKIAAAPVEFTVYPSFSMAFNEALKAPVETVIGVGKIFQHPDSFSSSVSGPAQMVHVTSLAIQEGVLSVLEIAAILSISVGIFNLLPFPPLDGGQMAIAVAEMLRGGKRLSIQIQGLVSTLGLMAVLVLMCSAVYFDIQELIPKSKPAAAPVAPLPDPKLLTTHPAHVR